MHNVIKMHNVIAILEIIATHNKIAMHNKTLLYMSRQLRELRSNLKANKCQYVIF